MPHGVVVRVRPHVGGRDGGKRRGVGGAVVHRKLRRRAGKFRNLHPNERRPGRIPGVDFVRNRNAVHVGEPDVRSVRRAVLVVEADGRVCRETHEDGEVREGRRAGVPADGRRALVGEGAGVHAGVRARRHLDDLGPRLVVEIVDRLDLEIVRGGEAKPRQCPGQGSRRRYRPKGELRCQRVGGRSVEQGQRHRGGACLKRCEARFDFNRIERGLGRENLRRVARDGGLDGSRDDERGIRHRLVARRDEVGGLGDRVDARFVAIALVPAGVGVAPGKGAHHRQRRRDHALVGAVGIDLGDGAVAHEREVAPLGDGIVR